MTMKSITPVEHVPLLAKAIGLEDMYLKREDLHPLGSHKGRSIPVMIDYHYGNGDRNFAISSSGNAALAAALHARHVNMSTMEGMVSGRITLDIYVGQNIAPHKLEKLKSLADDDIRILSKERPLQALMTAEESGVRGLRQSTDDIALVGYKSLAEEICMLKTVDSVFVATSSGTTAQALAQYFSSTKKSIQVHIVQTSSCHPLVESFESYDGPDEKSRADAIVDRIARRRQDLIPALKKVGGYGWYASNDDISAAQNLIKEYASLEVTANGALSVVGAMHAAYRGFDVGKTAVCIIGGE